jgi:hypothetical protein
MALVDSSLSNDDALVDLDERLTTVETALDTEEALNQVLGVADGYKVARGVHTTAAASDTVVTGLATVVAIIATLASDPVDGAMYVTASIGDQAGTPAAGSVLIKTWKNTDADATHVAATTFSLGVNWIAIGT